MAVPKYYEMYHSFLQSLSDGEEHPYSDVKKKVIEDFKLTDTELAELLPSGKQPVFSNRIGWCRTYLKKMEGEIPIETDKIEGTDEEWKGFREFSEKVSRKLNRRIVMVCGVVFLICMMLTVALYSDSFQSYHLSRIAAEDIKVEEVYQLKNGRLYVHVKSKRRITGLSYPQTDIDTDTNTVAGKDAVGAVREPKNSVTYEVSMDSSINPFAGLMYITSKEAAYVIPFEDGQIITDNGTKASEFDYVGRSGEKKILWQENDEVKKAPARVEKFVKESLEKEEDDPADENAVKVLWVNPQMPLQ